LPNHASTPSRHVWLSSFFALAFTNHTLRLVQLPSLGSGDFAKAQDKKGFLGKIYFLT